MKKVLISLLVLSAMLASAGCAGLSSPANSAGVQPRTLTVNGVHQVFVTPDIAYVTVGVHTESEEVGDAVDENNRVSERVMAALRELGVNDQDMQTSNFGIYRTEKWNPEGAYTGMIYMVDNSVYLIVRDLSKLSELLDAAVTAGANNIWGVQFDKADKTAAIEEGRAEATEKAKQIAVELAEAAGVTLGEIYSVSSYGGYASPISYGGIGGGGGFSEGGAVPISPGQLAVQVDVSLVFIIE